MRSLLDAAGVEQARSLAAQVGRPIVELARAHTTVSVERATLRLAGLSGADPDGTPWVNHLVDAVRADVGLEHGVALPVWDAVRRLGTDLAGLAQLAVAGEVRFELPSGGDADAGPRGRHRRGLTRHRRPRRPPRGA